VLDSKSAADLATSLADALTELHQLERRLNRRIRPEQRRSELTTPFSTLAWVDVASPVGGVIPVDPLSVKSIIRTAADDRLLADAVLRTKITNSLPIASVDINSYDIVYLAGGWGAAFDLGFSEPLATKITEANAADKIIGGVCHGPLGLINATAANGRPLVEGRHVTGVSNRQVRDLRITHTPRHPETELRRKGALYESQHPDLRCAGEPLGHRWQSDHRSEPERRSHGGP
jgi:putative intracellular protease/amidase